MANAGFTSAQLLPRFLLPRLSWQAVPVQCNSIRALSTLSIGYQSPSHSKRPTSKGDSTRSTLHAVPRAAKSSMLQSPTIKRAFHATARQYRDHHFDTLKFVQRLQEEGFTEAQSVAMMKVLSDVIEERYVWSLSSGAVLTSPVSKISLVLWSYGRTKRKQHTHRRSTLRSSAQNFYRQTRLRNLPQEHLMNDSQTILPN